MVSLNPPTTVLLCTDGSDLALSAIRQGLALLAPTDRVIVLTVAAAVDPTLVTGTGFAGGVMSIDEKDELLQVQRQNAQTVVDETIAALGIEHAEGMVEFGDAGRTICDLAASLPANVVVLGTHGKRGIRRAIMGSTSDHVVRHAACPVLVQGGG